MGGGGQQKVAAVGGGVVGFPRCSAGSQVQVVDGRGWCSGSTCLGRDWTGLGLETAELPGDHGQQGGTGHKIGGTLYGKVEGDAVQLHNVGAPKKGDEMGQAKRKADGQVADDRPIEYPAVGSEDWLAGLWLDEVVWLVRLSDG